VCRRMASKRLGAWTYTVGIINNNINNNRPLKMGTLLMLNRVLKHSRSMSRRNILVHSARPRRHVCGARNRHENVAQNVISVSRPRKPSDPVKMCVVLLVNSKTHRNNILSGKVTHTVMGAHIDNKGYVWCTQTFWKKNSKYAKGMCRKAS